MELIGAFVIVCTGFGTIFGVTFIAFTRGIAAGERAGSRRR